MTEQCWAQLPSYVLALSMLGGFTLLLLVVLGAAKLFDMTVGKSP